MKTRNACLAALTSALLLAACSGTDGDDGETNKENSNTSKLEIAEHPAVSCNEKDVCTIGNPDGGETEITQDLEIAQQEGVQYKLSGKVFVGDGEEETTLTIKPGVTLYAGSGKAASVSYLVIRQNSKINAVGTKDEPIVLTTSVKDGERRRGQWGGLVINGNAPLNSGETNTGEGGTGTYGGDDPEDSSGKLKYVRVEFAGTLFTEEDELNGIGFQGVGSGTELDYIQVHMNKDDGVEFFGGTASIKHLVLTGIGDDSLDWTDGWRGNIQHVLIQQHTDDGDRGIEADNLEEMNDATPRSNPTISNMTIIGGGSNTGHGVLLRRGTAAQIYNSIIVNTGETCLDIDSKATFENAWDASDEMINDQLTVENTIFNDCGKAFDSDEDGDVPFTAEQLVMAGDDNMLKVDPKIEDAESRTEPNYMIASDSPAVGAAKELSEDWFDKTDYIGAVGPDSDWTKGWTIHAKN